MNFTIEQARERLKGVNEELTRLAGWKNRAVVYPRMRELVEGKFGCLSVCMENDGISVRRGDGVVGRISRDVSVGSGSPVVTEGTMFSGCRSLDDVVDAVTGAVLGRSNVKDLMMSSAGCTEMIPVVYERTLDNNTEPLAKYFFPSDRWDIRQALLAARVNFEEVSPERFDSYRNEAVGVNYATEVSCVLYDGKSIHSPRMGRVLTGELSQKQYRNMVNAWNDLKLNMRSAHAYFFERAGRDYDAGVHPVFGHDSIFMFEGEKVRGGVYIDASGRFNVCGPDGFGRMPFRSDTAHEHYEDLMNTPDKHVLLRGVKSLMLFFSNSMLTDENIARTHANEQYVVFSPADIETAEELEREMDSSNIRQEYSRAREYNVKTPNELQL